VGTPGAPVKLGIALGRLHGGFHTEMTVLAEALGFESVWLPEHLVLPAGPVEAGHQWARWSKATLIAPVSPWVASVVNAARHSPSGKVWVSIGRRSMRPDAVRSR